MMRDLKKVQSRRDYLLVAVLFLLLGSIFLAFQLFSFKQEASSANVYYGNSREPIVTIHFNNNTVVKNYTQEVPIGDNRIFPLIDYDNNTITLLGDFEIQGVRQIVVIRFDFEKRSVEVIEEQSPKNICSRKGESTAWPLICLPNQIRIEFETNDEDFIV